MDIEAIEVVSGALSTIRVAPESSVSYLKTLLQDKYHTAPSEQILFNASGQWMKDSQSLDAAGVSREQHLVFLFDSTAIKREEPPPPYVFQHANRISRKPPLFLN
jgi:hypothetical protein